MVSNRCADCLFLASVLNNIVTYNSCLGAYCRGIQASALCGDIPVPLLGRRMTRWQTPVPALALAAVVCCILLGGFGFDTIIVVDSSVSIAMFIFLYASFLRLRYSSPNLKRPYVVLGRLGLICGAWVAIIPLALLICLAVVVLCCQAYWGPAAGLVLVVISFAGAWAVDWRTRRRSVMDGARSISINAP